MEGTALPLWAIAVIAGPIILGGAMAYGRWRNRKRRKAVGEDHPSRRAP